MEKCKLLPSILLMLSARLVNGQEADVTVIPGPVN